MIPNKASNEIQKLELKISTFLRYGVFISAFFMIIGWILETIKSGSSLEHLKTYNPIGLKESFLNAYDTGDWATIFTFIGLIVLISLPVIRVFLTAFVFTKQKDKIMVALALFVFIKLIIGLFLGFSD